VKLLYRLGFYMIGFSIGLIFLAVILKGKKTSCNYGPNDRVISNLSKKNWSLNQSINPEFDSIAFHSFLTKSNVDFGKSDTLKDSCKTYLLNGYWREQPFTLRLENCEKEVRVLELSYRSE